jgi:2-polyprenyl-3-methyl-5-hydroxy-6-metoxy-1,4-benzoquinol methylase
VHAGTPFAVPYALTEFYEARIAMTHVGDTLGYRLLTRIAPNENARNLLSGDAYLNKSKLQVLFGNPFFKEIQDKTVIDFGCGTGAEAVEMAQRGARRVLGIDIREKWLVAARERAAAAGVADRCVFMTTPDEPADIVVSLDSFEHFDDPGAILKVMDSYLNRDGKVIASFGPPWYHPAGGHLFSVFPWAHLLFTENALLSWRKSFRPTQSARTITDCGLNKMTLRRFRRIVADSPFRFERYEARPIRGYRLLSAPIVREFGTSVVICRLAKREAAAGALQASASV